VTHAKSVARTAVAPHAKDRNIVGWFLDNEVYWGADFRGADTLLASYEKLPAGAPGRSVADRYQGNPNGFLRAAATRYFQVTTRAVHAVDPHHLILGTRPFFPSAAYAKVAGRYLDAFDVHDYALTPQWTEIYTKCCNLTVTTGASSTVTTSRTTCS
jgi:hypothetical protein